MTSNATPNTESILTKALRERGSLADVDIRCPSGKANIGITRAAAGIEDKLVEAREVLFPREKLLEIQRVGRRIRTLLELRSLPFPGGGKYMPTQAAQDFVAQFAIEKSEHDRMADALTLEFPEIQEEQTARWYSEITALLNKNQLTSEQADRLRARLHRSRSTAAEFRAQFSMDLRLTPIPTPTDLNEAYEALARERERAGALDDEFRAQIERTRREGEEFAQGLVATLRTRVVEALTHLRDVQARQDGRVNDKNLRAIRETFESVKALNFVGDRDLDATIARFEATLGGAVDRSHGDGADVETFQQQFTNELNATIDGLNAGVEAATRVAVAELGAGRIIRRRA